MIGQYKNVLILSPELPAHDSGGPLRALQHLHLLNRIGLRPHLLTFFHAGQEAAAERMQGQLGELTRELVMLPAPMPRSHGIGEKLSRNVRYLLPLPGAREWWGRDGYEKDRYPLARAFDEVGAGERLVRMITENRIDIVIVMHAWLLHYLPLLRRNHPSVHVILDLVDLDSDLFAQLLKSGGGLTQQARHLVGWLTTRRLERRYFPMCDEFWAIAPTEAAKIRRICGARPIPVLPSVIDVDCVQPCESEGATGHLLFVGSLSFTPNKNAVVHLLKRLFPRIRAGLPSAHLTIVGRGLNPAVERLARQSPGVTLTGYVPATRPFYENAQVVVVPIREGCGIRLKILEALAMGRAVVATPKAAEGLELVDGEHIIIADSDDGFVSATLELLEKPERRRALARNGRALVERRYSCQAAERIMAAATGLGHADSGPGTSAATGAG